MQEAETQAQDRRYYSPTDPESYVTPDRFKRLGKKKQVAYMVDWFRGMFDDPANEMPYESREGGFQYVWGGPYDAAEELGSEFGDIASDEVIDAAVSEVESDGIVEWAPGPNHPNQKALMEEAMGDNYEPPPPTLKDIRERLARGVTPRFGDPLEMESRASLRSEIARLRDLMEREASVPGGIGHNHPPEPARLAAAAIKSASVANALIPFSLPGSWSCKAARFRGRDF